MSPKLRQIFGLAAVGIIAVLIVCVWMRRLHQAQIIQQADAASADGVDEDTTGLHVIIPPAQPTTLPSPWRRERTPEQIARAEAQRQRQALAQEEEFERQQAEIAEVIQSLNRADRTVALPQWVRGVAVTSSGQPVIYTKAKAMPEAMALRMSAQQFAAGKSPVIRGGRLALADSLGRLWLIGDTDSHLFCLDHGAWSSRLPDEGSSVPPIHERQPPHAPECFIGGWQSRDGVCWFLAYSHRGYFMHSKLPSGTWGVQLLAGRDEDELRQYQAGVTFVEQDHGLLALGTITSQVHEILCFDGSQWNVIPLPQATDRSNPVNSILPIKDGSILVFNAYGHISTFWPPAAAKFAQARVDEYISALNDLDFEKRRSAFEHLSLCGALAADHLRAAVTDPTTSPEVSDAAKGLLAALEPQYTPAGGDVNNAVYAGRYRYKTCTVCVPNWKGSPLLQFGGFIDTMKQSTRRFGAPPLAAGSGEGDIAFAVLKPDGEIEAHESAYRDIAKADVAFLPFRYFADSESQIWANGRRFLNSDLTYAQTEPGVFFTDMLCEDSAGRLYTGRDGEFFIRPRMALAAPELAEQEYRIAPEDYLSDNNSPSGDVYHQMGKSGLTRAGGNPDGPRPERLKIPYPAKGFVEMMPLANHVVIASWEQQEPDQPAAALYDRRTWHPAGNMADLVTAMARTIAANLPINFRHYGTTLLSGDGAGHFWFWNTEGEPQPDAQQHGVDAYPCERFWYYDGLKFHDVWAEWNIADGKPPDKPASDPLHSASGEGYPDHRSPVVAIHAGVSMLVSGPQHHYWEVHYQEKKLIVHPLTYVFEKSNEPPEPVPVGTPAVPIVDLPIGGYYEERGGRLWMSIQSTGYLSHLDGSVLTVTATQSDVLLLDSHQHLWTREGGQRTRPNVLHVANGQMKSQLALPDEIRIAYLREGPDGRLWLIDEGGLSEIQADDAPDGSVAIRLLHRWRWPEPRLDFDPRYFDDTNGLWFSSGDFTRIRVSLPARAN